MIEAFLLLFAQWYSITNAEIVVTPPSCYYSANQTLATVFMPCGDPQNGHKSCCQAGDNCLSDNACFNPAYETTYLAGCTDEEYGDSSCPSKPNLEEHSWVGLVTCTHVSTDWYACSDNGPTITRGLDCTCPQTSATLAFIAVGSPLENIMQLGQSYGDSSCFPGFTSACAEATQTPSAPTSSTAAPSSSATKASTPARTSSLSLTTSSGGSISTVFMTTTAPVSSSTNPSTSESSIGASVGSTSSPSNPSTFNSTSVPATTSPSPSVVVSVKLHTPAAIGIGVGSAVGGVVMLALLWYCSRCLRKKKKRKSETQTNDKTGSNSSDEAKGFAGNDQLGDDDPRSPTWSGHNQNCQQTKI